MHSQQYRRCVRFIPGAVNRSSDVLHRNIYAHGEDIYSPKSLVLISPLLWAFVLSTKLAWVIILRRYQTSIGLQPDWIVEPV